MSCRTVVTTAVLVLAVMVTVAGASGCAPSDSASDASGSSTGGEPNAAGGAATVVRIVDGDTLVAHLGEGDERVRLIGIDTPETKKPDSPVECFGAEASAHLKDLLPEGTPIRLERDAELRDKYDRLLAYVYRSADGLFVNMTMAREGYAGQLTIPPNVAHVDEVGAAVAEARDAGRGLWHACSGPHQKLEDTG